MATIASVVVKIAGDSSGLRKELNAVKRQMRSAFGGDALEASRGVVTTLAGVSAAIGAVGIASLKLAGDLEQTKVAFTSMLHSGEKAEAFLKDLQKFAASTPFGFDQVKGAAQKFLAFGFTAEQVIPVLTAVGDSAAALGMGQDGIDRLALALGQMAAKGKVSGEEMKQLAEAGIPAWRMLAETLNVSVAEAMDMVSKGAVNAQVGLEALVKGMESNFGGMMEQQSQTINGLFSSILDNVIIVGQNIGTSLAQSLNLQGWMSEVNNALQTFAQTVSSSGVSEAIKNLVPPSVVAGVMALAGALMGAAVPALVSMATAAVAALAPLLPFIAIGAAIGAAFYLVYRSGLSASEMLGVLGINTKQLSNIWINFKALGENTFNAIMGCLKVLTPYFVVFAGIVAKQVGFVVNVFLWLLNTAIETVNWIVGGISWLANSIADGMSAIANWLSDCASAFGEWAANSLGSVGSFVKEALAWLGNLINKVIEVKNALLGTAETASAVTDGKVDGKDGGGFLDKVKNGLKNINFSNFAGGGGGGAGAVGGGGGGGSRGGGGGGGSSIDHTLEDAKQISKSIEDAWVEAFKTKAELVDRWYKEETDSLEKSKSANENYERDKTRLAELYAEKRIKAVQEEERKKLEIYRSVRDAMASMKDNTVILNMGAGAKVAKEIETNYTKSIEAIKDKWKDLENTFVGYSKAEKEVFLKQLEEQGVAYETLADGRISLEVNALEEMKALQKKYQDDVVAMHNNASQAKAEIDKAYAMNSLTLLQESLTAQRAEQINNAEATKSIMDAYKEAMLASHMTNAQLMGDLYNTGFKSMSTEISNILEGTKGIGQAFQAIGKAITKVISDYIAKWIAGRIMQSVIGKQQAAAEVATGRATGAALAGAYREAAFYASIASAGLANSFGLTTLAMGKSLSMPMLASGGLAYGPTVAMIGEGKHKEAVVPLNKEVLGEIGQGISDAGGASGNTIIINAPLDGRRAIADYFARNGDVITEGLGLANGVSVDYGGALT